MTPIQVLHTLALQHTFGLDIPFTQCAPSHLKAGLPGELLAGGSAEVVVRIEGRVERGDEVEERLALDLVLQGIGVLVAAAAPLG